MEAAIESETVIVVNHSESSIMPVKKRGRPAKKVTAPKRRIQGIRPEEFYFKQDILDQLNLGNAAWQSMRDDGMRVHIKCKRAGVLGAELIRYFTSDSGNGA